MKKLSWVGCAAVMFHIWILWSWYQDNYRLTKGVCCGFLSPVERAFRQQGGEIGWYAQILEGALRQLENPSVPIAGSAVSMVLAMVLLLLLRKRL